MISVHHKVIFVHIPKCAGQSIEKAFLRNLGLDWERRYHFLLRPKNNNELGPERLAHLYANEYVKFGYIDEIKFRNFYKFSIVRDPIDRIISELNFQKISKSIFGVNSVEEYIVNTRKKNRTNSDLVRHLEPQVKFLFDDEMENILVDKVILFDEIEHQFESVKRHIGFNDLELKHENVSQSKQWLKSDLTKSDTDFLKEIYKADYKLIANYT